MSDKEELEKRVAKSNAENKGKGHRPRGVNSRPNRVDGEFQSAMRDSALEFWPPALLAFRKATQEAIDAVNSNELSDKQRREKLQIATGFNPLLKQLAQFSSGAVHPTGHNTITEKQLAAERVQTARDLANAKDRETLEMLLNTKKEE